MSVSIHFDHVVKKYGENTIIPDLNLDVKEGEFFTLLGPSGCGKTTLLRQVAGFNTIEGGTISFNGKVINDIAPNKRNIGMVFQNYAVFPHMTVRENVAFGLENRHIPKDEIKKRVDEILETVLGDVAVLQTEGHVLAHGHVREDGIVLEDHADVALVGRDVVDDLAVEGDRAAFDGVEAGHLAQKGRFAAARRAQQGKELALFYVEVEIGDDGILAVLLDDVIKMDGNAHFLAFPFGLLLSGPRLMRRSAP